MVFPSTFNHNLFRVFYRWAHAFSLFLLFLFALFKKTRRALGVIPAVLRIRIYYYADPDPGSKKCPYGSGS